MEESNIFVKKVQSIIEKNLGNPDLNSAFIAQALGISRMHLHRKLTKITEEHTRNYITTIRIENAKMQLLSTSKFIYQIASDSGFRHYTYFSKVFKKQTGMSPTEFRRQGMC